MNVREERFKRIAEKRVNKLLEDFRLLGNCSNKSNYDYSDEDLKKIISVIDKEFKKLKDKFVGNKQVERFFL
jgi:uncharacterized Fe-S cluster-containing protein